MIENTLADLMISTRTSTIQEVGNDPYLLKGIQNRTLPYLIGHHQVNNPEYKAGIGRGDPFTVPMISPLFRDELPVHITDLLARYPDIAQYPINNLAGTVVIATILNNIPVVAVYRRGGLAFATEATFGGHWSDGAHLTSEGKTTTQEYFETATSSKYQNSSGEDAPMNYAVKFAPHQFFHVGQTGADGKSHGCIHIPARYAPILFHLVPERSEVITIPRKISPIS